MPGMLLTAKEEELVLNGLTAQGAHVRQTKRGWMVGFPNGQSAVMSFQGDHRRVKNARALVRRNDLRWPLDPPEIKREAMPTTEATEPQFRTEYADYLKAEPKPEILSAVEKFMQGRETISIPALVVATGFSANPVTQALLRLGYLQESGFTQSGKGRLRMWHKAPLDFLTKVTYTSARMPTGKAAASATGAISRTAEELRAEREEKRYERPEHAKAEPPFTPLDKVEPVKMSKPKPPEVFGPVRVSSVEERLAEAEKARLAALGTDAEIADETAQESAGDTVTQDAGTPQNDVNPGMTAPEVVVEVVESVMPDTMAARAEAEEAMLMAEQMEARAVEAERQYADEHRELEALRLELRSAEEMSERRRELLERRGERINELQVERDRLHAEAERRGREVEELQAEVLRQRERLAHAEDMEPVMTMADPADTWPVKWEELDAIAEHSIATYRDMLKAMGLTAMLRRD